MKQNKNPNKNPNLDCITLNSACVNLVIAFADKYYKDDYTLEWIDWRDEDLHYNLMINDEYWNVDEIYTAMRFDIPKKILFNFKELQEEKALMGEKI